MSFSSEIKDEIMKNIDLPECCTHAFAYGMLLFGRSFNLSEISLLTDNGAVAEKYIEAVKNASGVEGTLSVSQAGKYTVDFKNDDERRNVLSSFSSTGKAVVQRVDRGNLSNDSGGETGEMGCCDISFIKGAFLSCGTASDPNKSYHIEFVVPYKKLCNDFICFLEELGFKPKYINRKGNHIVYFKDSESIEDMLAVIGAQNASLYLMGVKIEKDVKNKINRKMNFELSNIDKTIDAASPQIEAILFIDEKIGIDSLPDNLREIAHLRIENPESSLRDLGMLLSEPLSRSGVNHRLARIVSYAEKLKAGE